jgi:hypothetical protein
MITNDKNEILILAYAIIRDFSNRESSKDITEGILLES